jgi:hypothetical protein
MNKLINTIKNSQIIIAALVLLVFVTGYSLGYQTCLYYTVGHSDLFGDTKFTKSIIE